jgi:predicted nucleic acid-binding Zn ribbon protein
MKSAGPAAIKDLLRTSIENIAKQAQAQAGACQQIKQHWQKIVGKEASNHTSPARLKGKTLIVNVDSPIWIYQLATKKAEIEKGLNRLMKRKDYFNIRLRAGEAE